MKQLDQAIFQANQIHDHPDVLPHIKLLARAIIALNAKLETAQTLRDSLRGVFGGNSEGPISDAVRAFDKAIQSDMCLCGKLVDHHFPEIGLCQSCLDHRNECDFPGKCHECKRIENHVASIQRR